MLRIRVLLWGLLVVIFFGGCRKEAFQITTKQNQPLSQDVSRAMSLLGNQTGPYKGRLNRFQCSSGQSGDPKADGDSSWHLAALNIPAADEASNKSIEIGISDTGLDGKHEDFEGNTIDGVDFRSSKDGLYGTDPIPDAARAKDGDHGTNVAGIVGAVSCNGRGGRGVAPNSKLGGINLIAPEVMKIAQFNSFLLYEPQTEFKIFNQSWGYDDNLTFWANENSNYISQIKTEATGGKVFIKAAGNSFPRDAAYDPDQRNPYTILVAALNQEGTAASYSVPGANLWVTAPSAEPQAVSGIFTTEATAACSNSANCYQTGFNGTSAAAPMVTGVVALMLQKNDRLSWRDIKYILAKTSTKVGDQGWVKNQAGFHFSRDYGFGLVDAKAAVEWAECKLSNSTLTTCKDKTFSLDTFQEQTLGSRSVSIGIPDNQETGITSSLTTSTNLTIEAIELTLNITHQFPSDLHITLTSPSGTEAVVLAPHPGFFTRAPHMRNIRLMVNHFYGENTKHTSGKWTLKIADRWQEDSGTLNSWSLKAYGH